MPYGLASRFWRTFRFRVMAWLVVVVVGMMMLTTLFTGAIVQRSINNTFDRELQAETEELRLAIEELFPGGIPREWMKLTQFEELKHTLDRRAKSRGSLRWFLRLYDSKGKLAYHSESPLGADPANITPGPNALSYFEEGNVRYMQTPFPVQNPVLWIRIGRSLAGLREDVQILNQTLYLRAIFVLLLAPAGGYVLARQVTGPLSKIVSTASRLQPEHMAERLPVRGTGDELDQLAITVNGLLDRVAEYLDKNRAFVANAAHELRSPLAAIRSSAEVALNRHRTPEEYATLLGELVEEVGNLSSMVNRLLLLAESDAGRIAPSPNQTARFDKVINESVDMFQAVAESLGVHLEFSALPSALIPGDELHLRHVVRNLIDNAIKFSPAGGTIKLTLSTTAREAVFSIQDQGPGIPTEDIPRLFERFFRGDKSRHRDEGRAGSGLGLSICQAIVSALHGDIRVESRPEKGSTFTVTLPLAAASDKSGN